MMRPFNRGLKTLITTGLVVMLAVTFLAPAASALQWDPSDPPVYPWLDSNPRTPEQDETPWGVDEKSSSDNSWTISYFYGFWMDSYLYSIGVRYIIFEGTTSLTDSDTDSDIQSGASNGSN